MILINRLKEALSNKMPMKMLKADYVNLIEEHFAKQGKKMANLSKATIAKLKEIIKKYNIECDEKKVFEEKAKAKQEEEEERKAKAKQEEEERKDRVEWNTLTEEDKEKILTWVVLQEQKDYVNNYWRIQKKNNDLIKRTDAMEVAERVRPVERINENTVCISGINFVNGCIKTFDWNESFKNAKKNTASYDAVKILEQIKLEENAMPWSDTGVILDLKSL